MTPVPPPDLMTIREVAAYLRETDHSIRRRIHGGQLRAWRVGTKRILIRRADVEALLRPVGRTE